MAQIHENDKDGEHREAIREFFRVYNSLKKRRALRWGSHSDPKGAWIEIWEYKNNGEIRTICRVKAENSAECYQMAAESLKNQ